MRRGRLIFWSISGTVIAGGFGYVGWLAYSGREGVKLAPESSYSQIMDGVKARSDLPPEPWAPSRAWWKEVTIDAFEKATAGKSWPSARRAVVAFGADLSGDPPRTADEPEDAAEAATTAVDDFSCDDPLVRWIAGRYGASVAGRRSTGPAEAALGQARRQVILAADELRKEGSPYSPLLRCLALAEAAAAAARGPVYFTKVDVPRAGDYLAAAAGLFPQVAADPKAEPSALLTLANTLGDLSRTFRRDRMAVVEPLAAALEKAGHPKSLVLTVRGDALVGYAWDARGSGMADTVNEDAAQGFAKRLALARAALTEAWESDHGNSEAAARMLTVCMGESADAVEVDRWFKRAIEANPSNFNAVSRKLLLLEPKWGGSPVAMILFGRELARTATDPRSVRLPLGLVEAHWTLAHYVGGGNPDPSYFADNPDLWDDVSRVYEKYLTAAPGSRYHRTRYAVIAAWAGHWDVANVQFDKLGDRFSRSAVAESVVKSLRAQGKRANQGEIANRPGAGKADAAAGNAGKPRAGAAGAAAPPPARKRADDGL